MNQFLGDDFLIFISGSDCFRFLNEFLNDLSSLVMKFPVRKEVASNELFWISD